MGLIATAMYLIACQNGGRFPFSFSHAHAGIGSLIVYFMFPAMLMLGVYVGATWDPSRTRTPIVVRIHVWSGRVLFASSSVEIQLGLLLVKAPIVWSILFWIWTIACATLTLIARRTAKSHLVMPKPPAWTSSYSIMRKMEDKGSIELEKQSHISSRFASGSTSFEAAHTAAYCSKEPHVNWPTTPPRVESDSLSRTIRDRKFVGVDANWKKKSLPDLRRETEKVLKTKVLTDVTLIDRLEIDTRIDSADTVVPVQRIIFEEPDEIGDDMDVEMIGGRMMFEEPEELSRLPTRTQD
ncbi:hypothetical protein HDU83_001240 [Entophlyctis luteolus]|nr:hypothetical protein HDU83_001240 [Entophlyctis luteolus]